MSEKLPQRDEEPTLGLIRELRDAAVLDEALMQRALTAKRPAHVRRLDAVIAEPTWDDLQILTAQLATKPLFESVAVDTKLSLGGANSSRRQTLASPLVVQLAPFEATAVAALRNCPGGYTGLAELHDARSDGASALCVDASALERHRSLLSAAELPFGVRIEGREIERGLTTAIAAGADFVILNAGGAAIRALAETRACLGRLGAPAAFAIILDGELRLPNDFIKALALGASGLIVASTTLDSILTLALASDLDSRELVSNFAVNTLQLIAIMARACGHDRISQFMLDDLTTWLHQVATVSGVVCSGQTHVQ